MMARVVSLKRPRGTTGREHNGDASKQTKTNSKAQQKRDQDLPGSPRVGRLCYGESIEHRDRGADDDKVADKVNAFDLVF